MGFRFRQFSLEDDRSTMKTGTDSVLLGCWASVSGCKRILEIGTGCGVIALVLAQRSSASIDAIDVDKNSVAEAQDNFRQSPWGDRLTAHHIPLAEVARLQDSKYDLIIANPPYFRESLNSPEPSRSLARHQAGLYSTEMLHYAVKLLTESGKLAVILPASGRNVFCGEALKNSLYLSRETRIITREGKKPELVMIEFSPELNAGQAADVLTLRNGSGACTPEYLDLTKDFYVSLK